MAKAQANKTHCKRGHEFTPENTLTSGGVRRCKECRKFLWRKNGRISSSRYPEKVVWRNMIARCTNPKVKEYKWYGARGISVCAEWLQSFDSFLKSLGPRPSRLHSLDRFPDNNGNYEPGNCRWALIKDQQNNKRSNLLLTVNAETKSAAEWSRTTGTPYKAITSRIHRGWEPEAAIFLPAGLDDIASSFISLRGRIAELEARIAELEAK